jgi:hypothetical protein
MKSKTIYDNGNSRLTVKYDGVIVTLKQELDGVSDVEIYLFQDELEDILEFVKENNSLGEDIK